jgi:DNA-binding transcriptional regulator LsrR (DeoR family)
MLEAELQAQILSLYFNDKKSIRQIALKIGVDRKTVRRVIGTSSFCPTFSI